MRKSLIILSLLAFILGSCSNKDDKLTDPKIDAKINVELGHYWNISYAAFSPDGKYLATAGYDRSMIIWDLATKSQVKKIGPKNAEEKALNYASFKYTKDGKTIVAREDFGKVVLIDAATGEKKKEIKVGWGSGKVFDLSSDEKYVLHTDRKNVVLTDITTGAVAKTFSGQTKYTTDAKISPDIKTVASVSGDTLMIWDFETAKVLKTIKFEKPLDNLAFSANSAQLAVNENDIKKVHIFDTKTWKEKNTLDLYAYSVVFSGEKLITISMMETTSWDTEKAEKIKTIKKGGYGLNLNANGTKGVIIRSKGAEVYDMATGAEEAAFGKDTRYVSKVHVSPTGKFIITETSHVSGSGGPDILSYAVDTAANFTAYGTSGSGRNILAFVGNTDVIFTEEYYGKQHFYNLANGKSEKEINDKVTDPFSITKDGALLIAKDKQNSKTYAIFDAKTGDKKKDLVTTDAYHYYSGLTSDDKYYVMVTMDFVKVWEMPDGKEVKSYKRDDMDDILFLTKTKDGKYLAGRKSRNDFVMNDILTGEMVNKAEKVMPVAAAVSTDGKTVAIASSDWTVKLFDIEKKEITKTMTGHTAPTASVCFSKDDKYIVSSAQDNRTIVWNTADGKQLLTIVGLEKTSDYKGETKDFVVFAPNGRYDGTDAAIKKYLYMEKDGKRLPVEGYKDKCYTPNLIGRTLGQNFIEAK